MKKNSGKNTLLMSMLVSLPGPLIVGIGLLFGESSTQIADFFRRSIELLAIILSFIVYLITTKDDYVDNLKKAKLEKYTNLFVSVVMIICGLIMIILALIYPSDEKGDVTLGLIIALLGLAANSFFWIRYTMLSKKTNNNILKVQSKLYKAKTFVDCSVSVTLLVVLISNNSLALSL